MARKTDCLLDDRLQLALLGKVLERWHTLSYYNIPSEQMIEVSVVKGWYSIFMRAITGRETIALEVHDNYSVRALKNQIEEREGTPADQQQLIFHGKNMNNNDATMYEYAILKDSTVHMVRLVMPDGEKIPVKVLGKTISLDGGRVKMIKRCIKHIEGIHQDEQMLMLADKELKDDQMTGAIEDRSSLDLVVRRSFDARLLFQVSSGKTWSIAVRTNDTIAGIKSKILNVKGIILPAQAKYVLEGDTDKTKSSHLQEVQELKKVLQMKQFTIQSQENQIRAKEGEVMAIKLKYDSLCQRHEEKMGAFERERRRSFQLQQERTHLLDDIRAKNEVITAKEVEIREKAGQMADLQKRVQSMDTGGNFTCTGNLQSWNIPRAEIQGIAKREIDRGAWGVVYSGTFRGERVAIKQAHREVLHLTTIEMLKREVLIMADLQHPNLVRFIGAVFDEAVERGTDMPIIVSELMDINLRAAYRDRNLFSSLLSIFRDVAYAIHYLHHNRQPIIHRDLSAPNVLLKVWQSGAYQAKVSDFGSANLLKKAQTAGSGAIVYSAPEMFPNEDIAAPPRPQTTKVDVFSYGVLMLEVIVKEIPTPELRYTMLQKVSRRWKLMYELIVHCTKPLPSDRPTMADILNKLNKVPLRN